MNINEHQTYTTMLLVKGFNLFRRIFTCFGLAPILNRNDNKKQYQSTKFILKSFLQLMPSITFIIVNGAQLTLQTTLPDDDPYGQTHLIILKLYFLITTASNVAANIQCIQYKLEYVDIIRRIEQIEHLFMKSFSKEIYIQKIMLKYKITFLIMYLLLISLEVLGYILTAGYPSAFILITIRGILELISTLTCLHPILYVDIVRMFLKELSSVLTHSKLNFRSFTVIDGAKKLNDIKFVHFELWKLVQKINIYFGWSFVILSIKFFIDITFDLYWIFIEFQLSSWQSLTHIRNGLQFRLRN